MKYLHLLFFIVLPLLGYTQEICDNGIDDDGDGLIDLNDDECNCGGLVTLNWDSNIIPNHSFEEMSCCPSGISDTDCVNDWDNIGGGTSDYLNTCDYWSIGSGPSYPLPSPGEGYVGFWPGESIGCCLTSPLLAGETYLFAAQFSTEVYWVEEPDLILSIYGGPDCVDFGDEVLGGCEGWSPFWDLIDFGEITLLTDNSWSLLMFEFTPTTDYYSLAISPCESEGYYYMDDVFIGDTALVGAVDIVITGTACGGDLVLTANADTLLGDWQWYKEGIALLGETGETLEPLPYGAGNYSAVYWLDGECVRADYTVEEMIWLGADFEVVGACVGQEVDFTNASSYAGADSPNWEWDFGDGATSTDENPTHIYSDPGVYEVKLIGTVETGCNDTTELEVLIEALPDAHFEFLVGGISSEDGGTGGCVTSTVHLNDLSEAIPPGVIDSWTWDFGDGATSTDENPTHTYSDPGTYTITLTVTTTSGCSSSTTLSIEMTEGLAFDLLTNDPTCFGFTDGSITVNVDGGGDDFTFEIKDSLGVLLNEDNSNAANNLSSGWYYVMVDDGTECWRYDSVFIGQPEPLSIDLFTQDATCYNTPSGWARVDSVYNATGDYGQLSFYWAPNPVGAAGIGADSLWNLSAGDYTLTINDENGCSEVIDFTINQPNDLVFSQFGFEHAYCRVSGNQSGNGVVFAAATGGTADYTYQWVNLETNDTNWFSTWGGLNPGFYEITVLDANDCLLTDTLYLDSLNPIAAFDINSLDLNEEEII